MSTLNTHRKPLHPDSLTKLAYEAIRDSIMSGRYPMGEHIVETAVAEELEISRGPVREALKRLTQEGLAVAKPRRGTFVREISAEDFIHIYNVRLAIETVAVRLVVTRGASLRSAEATLERLKAAARRGDVTRTARLELQIHREICTAAGNPFLLSILRSVQGPMYLALRLDDASYDDLEEVITEHVELLDCLRQGDPDAAAAAMQAHITSTVGPVLERLGGDPSELLTGL